MEISIQRKWTSPDGKIVVVTTPEQVKYNCYKLPLFQHLVIGEIEAEVKEYDRPAKGQYSAKHIREIVNVKVGGVWILKEQTEEPTSTALEPAGTAEPPTSDPTRKSIERQTALKCATELAVVCLSKGKVVPMEQLLKWASSFETYLKTGIGVIAKSVEKPPEKKSVETKPKIT